MPTQSWLVLGASGAGKSSLIRSLGGRRQDTDASIVPEVDTCANGVTKTANYYKCEPPLAEFGDVNVLLLDTAGFGDIDVPVAQSIVQIETQMKDSEIIGVIAVQSCLDGRLSLASQVLKVLAELGFKNSSGCPAWDRIIFCGTHVDMAKQKQRKAFEDAGIKFFTDPEYNPDGQGATVLCGDDPDDSDFAKEPYQPLIEAMAKIASKGGRLECLAPDKGLLAQALTKLLACDKDQLEEHIQMCRDLAAWISTLTAEQVGTDHAQDEAVTSVTDGIDEKIGQVMGPQSQVNAFRGLNLNEGGEEIWSSTSCNRETRHWTVQLGTSLAIAGGSMVGQAACRKVLSRILGKQVAGAVGGIVVAASAGAIGATYAGLWGGEARTAVGTGTEMVGVLIRLGVQQGKQYAPRIMQLVLSGATAEEVGQFATANPQDVRLMRAKRPNASE